MRAYVATLNSSQEVRAKRTGVVGFDLLRLIVRILVHLGIIGVCLLSLPRGWCGTTTDGLRAY